MFLNGRRILVTNSFNNLNNLGVKNTLLPIPQRIRNISALSDNTKVLLEDTPIALSHLAERLLTPMPLVPLGLGLPALDLLEARRLLRLLGVRAPLLEQVAVEFRLVALLLFDVDAGYVAATVELHLVAALVQLVEICRCVFGAVPVEDEFAVV